MNEIYPIIFGALLAIFGGYIGDEIRAWRERGRELHSIKSNLADELSDIDETVKSMHEVWEQTRFFGEKYVTELLSNTSSYDAVRPRLFLIKDKGVRKKLVAFYKKLKDTVKKSEGKVGSLAENQEAQAEQTALETSFQSLGTEAKNLKKELED